MANRLSLDLPSTMNVGYPDWKGRRKTLYLWLELINEFSKVKRQGQYIKISSTSIQ